MTDAVEEVGQLFAEAGLVLPPIPPGLAPSFHRVQEWCYASRDISAFDMYMLGPYPHEVVAGPVEDYVAVSHAGHGINWYALNYHLVYGWIALFVQVGWGGVYDGGNEAERIAAAFATCGAVLEALGRLRPRPSSNAGRLIVVQSDFRELNKCRWLKEPLGERDASRWFGDCEHLEQSALDVALTWLNE